MSPIQTVTARRRKARCQPVAFAADEAHVAAQKRIGLMTLCRQTCSEAHWAVSGTPTKHALSSNSDTQAEASTAREWTSQGMEDLKRLLGIMTNLLHMKPFDADNQPSENSSTNLVVNPLSRHGGPIYGAVARVENLIRMTMVRTRWVWVGRISR